MKKALAIFLAVLLMGNISASALWKFEATERICIGEGEVSFTDYSEGGMSLMAEGASFEETILAGWANLSHSINIEQFGITTEEELVKMYAEVIYENPKYYYIGNRYGYKSQYICNCGDDCECYFNDEYECDCYIENMLITAIIPTYTETDKSVIEEMWKQIDEETNNILLYVENDMTDFEKVMEVHDYMVLHYAYDHTLQNHSITIMVTKTGVCESYALAFNYIMDIIGIESVMVTSEEMEHAWNLVKVDGKWYHIDVTWDDSERPDQVDHQFELLSDERIQSMDNPHFGYDTGGRVADSDRFDNADWHTNHSQIVSIDGIDYWVSGNNLVDGDGNVIYEDLDGEDDKWSIGDGYSFKETVIYAGLAEFSGLLYFNTDKEIYSYNPKTGETKLIKEVDGICGLYIDMNTIRYCKYNRETSKYYEAGNMVLNGIRYAIPYVKDGKIMAEVYNGSSDTVKLVTFGKDGCATFDIESGINTFELPIESNKYMYIWDSNLRPLRDKAKLPE